MVLQETKICLSKAVLLKDAFTGKPVSSGIRICSLSGGRTERKGGGYFLFLDVDGPEFEIEIDSPIYQHRKLPLKSDGGQELEEILMYPSLSYPKRAGHTAIRGRAEPESVLKFHIEDEAGICRLLEDYKDGEPRISFYRKDGGWSDSWYIRKKQEKTGEYFRTRETGADAEQYLLHQPLKSAYQKKDTVIYPAKKSIADENGEFYLLLGDIPGETCILKYFYEQAGKETYGEVEIVCAKENRILEE